MWIPGLACMPMILQTIHVSPFDTCSYINGNHQKFNSSARADTQLRFNSWMRVECELNMGWTWVECQLKLSYDSTVECESSFACEFFNCIFAYSWKSIEIQQLNASSFACEFFNSSIIETQLNFSWIWVELHWLKVVSFLFIWVVQCLNQQLSNFPSSTRSQTIQHVLTSISKGFQITQDLKLNQDILVLTCDHCWPPPTRTTDRQCRLSARSVSLWISWMAMKLTWWTVAWWSQHLTSMI